MIVVVLLVIALAGGGFFLLSQDDGDEAGGGGGSPEQAARAFIEAARNQDCEALLGLISEQWLDSAGAGRDEQLATCEATEIVPYEFAVTGVEVVSQDSSRATVTVTAEVPGGTATEDVDLVNQGGAWKVDLGTSPVATATVEPAS